MKPLITIVTPSYNQGEFLERTILSVLQQDYPNVEFIIMDGGSKDNSVEVLKKYADKLTYWKSEKDKGQADAINQGWKMGKGVYCSYLNSDDELAPGALSAIAKVFAENPNAGMVYGDYTFVDANNQLIEEGKGHQTDFKKLLVNGQMPSIAQPSSFYRMDLVRQVNYTDESLDLSMDYDLMLKLSKISPIVYIPKIISIIRLHGQTKSTTLAKTHWHESLRVRRKYNILYSWKAILMYLRFRVFNFLPEPLRNSIRKRRNSYNDRTILGNKE